MAQEWRAKSWECSQVAKEETTAAAQNSEPG